MRGETRGGWGARQKRAGGGRGRRLARADGKEGTQGKGMGTNEAERGVAAARGYRHPARAFRLWRGKKAVLVKFVKNCKVNYSYDRNTTSV